MSNFVPANCNNTNIERGYTNQNVNSNLQQVENGYFQQNVQGSTYPQQYPQGYLCPENNEIYVYAAKRQIDCAYEAERSWINLGRLMEQERIKEEADCQRKARSLDLMERHENRYSVIKTGPDQSPIYEKEMLQQEKYEKMAADISQCRAVIYIPNIKMSDDKIFRILKVSYYNNSKKKKDSFLLDITGNDEKLLLKKLKMKEIKLNCGRRKQQEYSEKLLEWFISNASEVRLPNWYGFTWLCKDNQRIFSYVPEGEMIWKEMVKLCQ